MHRDDPLTERPATLVITTKPVKGRHRKTGRSRLRRRGLRLARQHRYRRWVQVLALMVLLGIVAAYGYSLFYVFHR